ncbi:MAG: DUF4255 domain-containing protein [Bacteroidota bacterium]
MIDQVLYLLSNELNTHFRMKETLASELSIVAGQKDPGDPGQLDKLVFTLVNVAPDKTLKNIRNPIGLDRVRRGPSLGLQLYVLLKADFAMYSTALNRLSQAVSFFHDRPIFGQQHPALPEHVERVNIELEDTDLESASRLWTMLGERYMPSVLYKVRLLVDEQGPIDAPVSGME